VRAETGQILLARPYFELAKQKDTQCSHARPPFILLARTLAIRVPQ
jgi:hypothetical protein